MHETHISVPLISQKWVQRRKIKTGDRNPTVCVQMNKAASLLLLFPDLLKHGFLHSNNRYPSRPPFLLCLSGFECSYKQDENRAFTSQSSEKGYLANTSKTSNSILSTSFCVRVPSAKEMGRRALVMGKLTGTKSLTDIFIPRSSIRNSEVARIKWNCSFRPSFYFPSLISNMVSAPTLFWKRRMWKTPLLRSMDMIVDYYEHRMDR